MKKIIIILVAVVAVIATWKLLWYKRSTCDPPRKKLTISTIETGIFTEYLPAAGEVIYDSLSDSLLVTAEIDQLYLKRISVGLKATTLYENKLYELKIKKIINELKNDGFKVILQFDSLISGSPKRLRLRIETNKPITATLLGVGGFYADTQGGWVFVVENNHAVKRMVKIGRKNTEAFEVLEGLKPGEKVITSSYLGFADRDSITIDEIQKIIDH